MIKTTRKGEWLQIICPEKWEGISIDTLLRKVWEAPKKQIHFIRMQKHIKVNGREVNWNAPLHINDKIEIKLFHKEDFGVIPSYIDIQVIYEDEHVIIVNKPAKMDTHPNSPDQANTLANGVAYHLQSKGEYCKVLHIHRLDQDTTGAVLFAKHSLAGSLLDRMLEKRFIKRIYVALIHGRLSKKKDTLHFPIGRDRHHPTRRRVSPNGQDAVTHYEVLNYNKKTDLTLIKCQLDTGRTHQIRVHFSHIGHPLAGDTLYGGKPIFNRQALHAFKLTFQHPFTEEIIDCIAPILDKSNIFTEIDIFSIK